MSGPEKKQTILIVDDIADNIEVLRGILSPRYRIKIATNGPKALTLANGEEKPDLILLDIMMPGMDGFEVCRTLKSQDATRDIPVIFVTAKDEVADEEKGFQLGAVDYITKPIIPQIAEARIATHLALRRSVVELAHQNEILNENARLREQVERIMRHDLKTPLTAFLGIPSLLKRRRDLPADVLETVGMMEKSGRRMLEMINNSLDLFRIESGTYDLHPVPVEITRIVNQIGFELSEVMKRRGVTLKLRINAQEPQENQLFTLSGEENLCYSALANLLKNAVEACPDQGTVTVALSDTPFLRVAIHNPGIIPAEIRPKFLQKFATHGKKSGTGLGGYSARLMTETMGGMLHFDSDEATGTTVFMDFNGRHLPVPPAETASQPQPQAQPPKVLIGDLRALIVDDNGMVLFTIREILRGMGLHQVHLAKSGEEAQEFIRANPPVQLIISDWNMPGMDGGEFLVWARTDGKHPQVPFIITTAEPNSERVKQAALNQVADFVAKPFSPDLLQQKIAGLLDRMKQLKAT